MSRFTRGAVGLAGAIALSLGVARLYKSDPSPPDADKALDRSDEEDPYLPQIARLEQKVSQLERTVARMQEGGQGPFAATTNEPKKRDPRPTDEEDDADQVREQDPYQASLDRLETEIVEQPRDPRWNAAVEVRNKVANVLPSGSQLRDLACQSTLCRLETVHADMTAYQAFVSRGFGKQDDPNSIWRGNAVFSIRDETANHGGVVAVAYLKKPEDL